MDSKLMEELEYQEEGQPRFDYLVSRTKKTIRVPPRKNLLEEDE